MKRVFSMIAVISTLAFTGSVCASEVLLTKSDSKSVGSIALDIVSDGSATAFDFVIPLASSDARKVSPKQIDLSNCVAELPKTHTGACAYRAKTNDIAVFVYSPTNALLPEGIIGVGRISAPVAIAKSLKVGRAEFSAPGGKVVAETKN